MSMMDRNKTQLTASLSFKYVLIMAMLLTTLSITSVRADDDDDDDEEEEEECSVCRGVVRKVLASVDDSKHSDMVRHTTHTLLRLMLTSTCEVVEFI